jgi:drug/metabolite transporter (DMT)-like permease
LLQLAGSIATTNAASSRFRSKSTPNQENPTVAQPPIRYVIVVTTTLSSRLFPSSHLFAPIPHAAPQSILRYIISLIFLLFLYLFLLKSIVVILLILRCPGSDVLQHPVESLTMNGAVSGVLHSSYHQLVARNSTSSLSSSPSQAHPSYKLVGLALAIASGCFIGVSFVLKKLGLLKANTKYNEEAGEGYGYLKNWWWWGGMTLMILGEICNFAAYLFADAILVTPLGALSVVITAILSGIFLKERLSFVGKIGCFNCIIGAVVIAANAPSQPAVTDIQDMKRLVISPGFLSYAGVIIIGCAIVAIWVAPKYGKKSMMVYLTVCSLIGGLSVICIQGIGAAIIAQARGEAQFNQWFLYVVIVFVITTLVTEIIYLNVSYRKTCDMRPKN